MDKLKILLVEDTESLADILSFFLKRHGHTVDIAHDGNEGLLKFQEGQYGFVITDYEMPGLDGLELTKLIKDMAPSTRIIFNSSNIPEGVVDALAQEALDSGAEKAVSKAMVQEMAKTNHVFL